VSQRNWRDSIPSGERLYSLVGIGIIAAVVVGGVLFIAFFVVPVLQMREELVSQLNTAEQELAKARIAQGQTPEELKGQLETAQTALNEAADVFLDETKAAGILNKLYQYADESSVEIIVLQSQSGSGQEKKEAYDVNTFQMQVEGPVPRLIDFVGRIEEAAFESFIITNVSIVESERLPVLTMDIALYTSPYASESTGLPEPTTTADLAQLEEALAVAWAAEGWAQAIDIIGQILALDPLRDGMLDQLYTARVNYGYQLLAERDRDDAITQFDLALEIKPGGEEAQAGLQQAAATPIPTQTAEKALEQRLHEAWEAEDWEETISLIESILAIDPARQDMTGKLYAAHVNYGYQLVAEGKREEAKEQFALALVVNPDGKEAETGLQALAGGTPASGPGHIVHVVQPGETLYRIALRYGTTVEAVKAANGLTSNTIYVGQRLRIPTQ